MDLTGRLLRAASPPPFTCPSWQNASLRFFVRQGCIAGLEAWGSITLLEWNNRRGIEGGISSDDSMMSSSRGGTTTQRWVPWCVCVRWLESGQMQRDGGVLERATKHCCEAERPDVGLLIGQVPHW